MAVKSKLHKVGVAYVACALCSKDEMVGYDFWGWSSTGIFWAWFQAQFHSLFTALLSWKVSLLGDTWMIRDNYKSLWHTAQLTTISFLWKHQCKVTFHEDPSAFSLGELWSFKQELALLVKV